MTNGSTNPVKRWAQIALLVAAYVGGARFGFLLGIGPGNITAVFPPSGIALAAILLGGYGLLPGVWIGSFAANLWFFVEKTPLAAQAPLAASALIATGSTLQAAIGALLIRRFVSFDRVFARPSDVARFTAVEALTCVLAATVGVSSLCVTGFVAWTTFRGAWFTWYLGDLVGVLLMTPLISSWSRWPSGRWTTPRVLESSALAAATLAAGWLILAAPFRHGSIGPLRGYYLFVPLVVWAAVRFGQRGVTLTAAAASGIAITTAMGLPIPTSQGVLAFIASLQMFASIAVLTGLLLASAIEDFERAESQLRVAHGELERRVIERTTELARTNETLREREVLLHGLFEQAPDAILAVGRDGKVIRANGRVAALFGWRAEDIVGQPVDVLLPERFRTRHTEHREDYGSRPRTRPMGAGLDLFGRRKDGSEFPVDIMLSPLEAAGGMMVIAIVRDITNRKRVEEQMRRTGEQLRALAARVQEVREQERTRMAREVHDELGQALTGLKMELGWVAKGLAAATDDEMRLLVSRVRASTQLIDEMIDSVRRIASDLRPGVLDDLGLVAAIEWQARDFERRTGIVCDVSAVSDVPLDRGVATAVFRIFQEILTNVARHAGGSRVEASLASVGTGAVLEVRDDGRGITEEELGARQSLGLLGMRERAVIFGGDVRVAGLPAGGTRVTVTIPRTRVSTAPEGVVKSGERSD